jgi:hypothetical protein
MNGNEAFKKETKAYWERYAPDYPPAVDIAAHFWQAAEAEMAKPQTAETCQAVPPHPKAFLQCTRCHAEFTEGVWNEIGEHRCYEESLAPGWANGMCIACEAVKQAREEIHAEYKKAFDTGRIIPRDVHDELVKQAVDAAARKGEPPVRNLELLRKEAIDALSPDAHVKERWELKARRQEAELWKKHVSFAISAYSCEDGKVRNPERLADEKWRQERIVGLDRQLAALPKEPQ